MHRTVLGWISADGLALFENDSQLESKRQFAVLHTWGLRKSIAGVRLGFRFPSGVWRSDPMPLPVLEQITCRHRNDQIGKTIVVALQAQDDLINGGTIERFDTSSQRVAE